MAIAAAVLVTDVAFSVRTDVSVPSATSNGYITVPLDLQVPLIIVSLVVASLDGPMTSLEETGSVSLRRSQLWYLACAFCAAGVLVGVTAAIMAPLGTALVLVRATAIWTGMALLSARVLRWSLAWALPLASFLPLTFFGADDGGRYYWWYWPRQPPGQIPCALIAACSLAVGACAMALTPWRLACIRAAAARMLPRWLLTHRRTSLPGNPSEIRARAAE